MYLSYQAVLSGLQAKASKIWSTLIGAPFLTFYVGFSNFLSYCLSTAPSYFVPIIASYGVEAFFISYCYFFFLNKKYHTFSLQFFKQLLL
jgi:hypothetical protein